MATEVAQQTSTGLAHIEQVVKQVLSASPLTSPRDIVQLRQMDLGWVHIYYSSHYMDKLELSINVGDSVFYLLLIRIHRSLRGSGLGEQLYDLCVQLAQELGCYQIRTMPSGFTPNGQTRMNYLLRRGWQRDGAEVYKELTLRR